MRKNKRRFFLFTVAQNVDYAIEGVQLLLGDVGAGKNVADV